MRYLGRSFKNWVPLLGAIPLADNAYLKRRCGRGRSGHCWYVRVPVPIDLQEIFRKRMIERALKTSDFNEAKRTKHSVLAEIFESFERARLGKINSADIEVEAQRYLRTRMEAIQQKPGDTFEAVKDEFGNELPTAGEFALTTLYGAQEEEDWPPNVETEAAEIARRYGVTLSETQRRELCRTLMSAEIQALARAIAAHNGEIPEPIPVLNGHSVDPVTAEQLRPTRLAPKRGKGAPISKAAKEYIVDRNRDRQSAWTAQTLKQAEATLRFFADFTSHGRTWRRSFPPLRDSTLITAVVLARN